MLVIRKARMHALAEVRTAELGRELSRLLTKYWPGECSALGPDALLQRVRFGGNLRDLDQGQSSLELWNGTVVV
jgi:hypothetical protein